jgi:hypothetical protein
MKILALFGFLGFLVNFLAIKSSWAESYVCYHLDSTLNVELDDVLNAKVKIYGYLDDFAHTTTLLEEFAGTVSAQNSAIPSLFQQKEIALKDTQGIEAGLKIIFSPTVGRGGFGRGGCGRGSCDFNNIKGIWNYKNATTKFECYENH